MKSASYTHTTLVRLTYKKTSLTQNYPHLLQTTSGKCITTTLKFISSIKIMVYECMGSVESWKRISRNCLNFDQTLTRTCKIPYHTILYSDLCTEPNINFKVAATFQKSTTSSFMGTPPCGMIETCSN